MSEQIRTRFAPSPTGYLHVGGLRTALFNFLFARHHGGKFILRIEDTDQTRYVEGAVEKIIDGLKWAGIEYDEGPDVGGEYGPYVQSQRTGLYRKYARQLVEQGDAYYCFCTAEKLEKMREEQTAKGLPTRYDGTCRRLSAEDVQRLLAEGQPHVIRLKMPEAGETHFTDLVRGKVTVQNELVDDQVLLKSDGFPTYHLANVVDDHLMGVTHVIRGEEWLLSVPKHLRLYEALGWEPPQMAHLSLLLNPDRSKLSKRQGDVAVGDYIEKGYLPQALVNFVALLGWSPGDDREFFTMEELIEAFSLERVNKSGAVFDLDKLNWMNGNYIRKLPPEELVDFLIPFLKREGVDVSDRGTITKIILSVYKNITRGDQIYRAARVFFKDTLEISDPEALAVVREESARTVLSRFLEKLENLSALDMDSFKATMKEIQKETGLKGPQLWKPVRVALTGELSGPELPAVIEIFGKDKVRSFVEQALQV